MRERLELVRGLRANPKTGREGTHLERETGGGGGRGGKGSNFEASRKPRGGYCLVQAAMLVTDRSGLACLESCSAWFARRCTH